MKRDHVWLPIATTRVRRQCIDNPDQVIRFTPRSGENTPS